jgi:hypothetical protein
MATISSLPFTGASGGGHILSIYCIKVISSSSIQQDDVNLYSNARERKNRNDSLLRPTEFDSVISISQWHSTRLGGLAG